MPFVFDSKFLEEKKVSKISGLMLNKYQRAYISQYDTVTQEKYYAGLDRGAIGKRPEDIPENLH